MIRVGSERNPCRGAKLPGAAPRACKVGWPEKQIECGRFRSKKARFEAEASARQPISIREP
jgi:hypothetical protein